MLDSFSTPVQELIVGITTGSLLGYPSASPPRLQARDAISNKLSLCDLLYRKVSTTVSYCSSLVED
jgi:hypothetical protein